MGLREQIAVDMAAIFDADAGELAEEVTYTPSGGSPFTASVIFIESTEMDMILARSAFADKAMCYILHTELSARSITAPVPKTAGVTGDTITAADADGNDEIWNVAEEPQNGRVIEYDRRLARWTLPLEKSMRLVP